MISLEASLEKETDYVESLKRVVARIKNFDKDETYLTCKLCNSKTDIVTVRDYIIAYASALCCVTYHSRNVSFEDYNDLFIVDTYIINLFGERRVNLFEELKRDGPKMCHTKKIDNMVLLAEEYFTERKMKINCELDIESLIYKVYKNSDDKNIGSSNSELILMILYQRNEYVRFFRIYKTIKPTKLLYKLAIIMTIREENDKDMNKVLETKIDDIEPYSYNNLRSLHELYNFNDIVMDLKGPENIDDWLKEKIRDNEWSHSLDVWSKNRWDGTGSVDRSMLETCIKKMRFEEGWYVFTQGLQTVKKDFHKAIYLCVRALKKVENKEIWVHRFVKVFDLALETREIDVCCYLVEDFFDSIQSVDEIYRSVVLREFIKRIADYEENEKIANYVLRGINDLCKKCINTKTCEFCVQHANEVYEQWKKSHTGGFFFKYHSQYEGEIFENILSVKDTVSDCQGFYNVCKDLADNKTKISQEMYRMIRKIHDRSCQNCKFNTKNNVEADKGYSFLQHICNKNR